METEVMQLTTNDGSGGNRSLGTMSWIVAELGYQTSPNAVTYTIIYSILLLLGLCGNCSTIVVVYLAQRKRGWTGIDAYLIKITVEVLGSDDALTTVFGILCSVFFVIRGDCSMYACSTLVIDLWRFLPQLVRYISLALADILLSLFEGFSASQYQILVFLPRTGAAKIGLAYWRGVPLEIYGYWRQYPWDFGPIVCALSGFLPETCLYASILTIVAFTFERYSAVKDPIRTFRQFSLQRTGKVIGAVWLVSVINAAPYAYYKSVNYLKDPEGRIVEETAWCQIPFAISKQVLPLFVYSAIAFYVVPMVILLVLYIQIGVLLRVSVGRDGTSKQSSPLNQTGDPQSPLSRHNSRKLSSGRHESKEASDGRKRTVKVLLAIVANFFICYGFFHVQRLIFVFVDDWHAQSLAVKTWNTTLYPITGFLYHANPVLDPIFYSMMSRRFQIFYRRMFCCDVKKPRRFPFDGKFSSFDRRSSKQVSRSSAAPQTRSTSLPRMDSTRSESSPPGKTSFFSSVLEKSNSFDSNGCSRKATRNRSIEAGFHHADIHGHLPEIPEVDNLLADTTQL